VIGHIAAENIAAEAENIVAEPEAWRGRPAAQQVDWPDQGRLKEVTAELAELPPLVLADECDLLRERLAAVCRGEAFVLQGGDCAETFEGATADAVRAKLRTLLQMALVLTYGGSVPVVRSLGWPGSSPSPAPARPRSARAPSCPPIAVTR
jgi:3-deoxy-7-phosphoheptulonate synthase